MRRALELTRLGHARRELHGHYWTLGSFVRGVVRPVREPEHREIRVRCEDPRLGELTLNGRLDVPQGARSLVLIVHGLGGDARSRYVMLAAHAAAAQGMASLRLHLRGADLDGTDVYHAGLTDDLHTVLASPELASMEDIYILGYSLGGHITRRYAAELSQGRGDPRVRAVAAVCAPVDLAAGVREIQRLDRRPYQFHVLRGLKAQYAALALRTGEGRFPALTPAADVEAIRTISEWDQLVICPRFGFRDPADYYEQAGIAPHLPAIEVPTLFVAASADPMVPIHTVRPGLERASAAVEVAYLDRGGHVGFPDDLRAPWAGDGGPLGLESGVLDWLRRRR